MAIVPVSELPVEESERDTPPPVRSVRGDVRREWNVRGRIVETDLCERAFTADEIAGFAAGEQSRRNPPNALPRQTVEGINAFITSFISANQRNQELDGRAVRQFTPGGREISFLGNAFSHAANQAANAMRTLASALRRGMIASNDGVIVETPNGPGAIEIRRGDQVQVEFFLRPSDQQLETEITIRRPSR